MLKLKNVKNIKEKKLTQILVQDTRLNKKNSNKYLPTHVFICTVFIDTCLVLTLDTILIKIDDNVFFNSKSV